MSGQQPTLLRRLPALLALLTLGAHFLRWGSLGLLLCVGLVLLLCLSRPWAMTSVQVGLVLGSLEWMRTLWTLVLERQALGLPWLRLSLILGAVALLTGLSACLLRGKAPAAPAD